MIFPLSIVSLLGLVCLGLLASPYPYLAPGAVLGLVGVAVLYRKPTWGLLGIAALVPFEGFFKDSAFSGHQVHRCFAGGDPDAATGDAPDSVRTPAQQYLALPDLVSWRCTC